METPSILSILPNLSIGVVSIVGLVYVVLKFLEALDKRAVAHEAAMTERENVLRNVEQDVREKLVAVIAESTVVIRENVKVMERVVNVIDKKSI